MKAYPMFIESIPWLKSHILELKENHVCHFFEIETVGKTYFLLSVDFFSGGYKF